MEMTSIFYDYSFNFDKALLASVVIIFDPYDIELGRYNNVHLPYVFEQRSQNILEAKLLYDLHSPSHKAINA